MCCKIFCYNHVRTLVKMQRPIIGYMLTFYTQYTEVGTPYKDPVSKYNTDFQNQTYKNSWQKK
jgi:hypothetical protein